MPPLRIQALGVLRVFVGDREVGFDEWRSHKAALVLKCLLTREPGEPVVRDVLMEALWPGRNPVLAHQSLRSALSALRRTLEPNLSARMPSSYVRSAGGYSRLILGNGGMLDVGEFTRSVEHAGRLERQGRLVDSVAAYRSAVAVYRGDFLADEPYAEWAFSRRERLRTAYTNALVRLGEHCWADGDLTQATEFAYRALDSDGAFEPAHRLLIVCCSQGGEWNRAAAAFRRYCDLLREYDVAPPASLESLLGELGLRDFFRRPLGPIGVRTKLQGQKQARAE